MWSQLSTLSVVEQQSPIHLTGLLKTGEQDGYKIQRHKKRLKSNGAHVKYLLKIMTIYESLPIKIRLFLGMLLAANTAALAIWLCFKYMLDNELSYQYCMGIFLIARVVLFMANKQMPLNDENVAFMSSERILWNLATIAVLAVMICLKSLIS